VERQLRGFEVVVVAGGGQLDELFGGPLTHLHGLWRYGAMARRSGARFVILSVGTGTLSSPVGRVLARRCLALADYASFRDLRSRELVGRASMSSPVVPDLAYGLPVTWPVAVERSGPPIVGVSPMAYADPRFWPREDVVRYRRHLASFAHLTGGLVRAGHRVVLFTTDGPDEAPRDELRAEVAAQLGPERSAMVTVATTRTVPELMQTLSQLDLVVSARLHGVLLSHVAGRPVLAIAHERKVATLMGEMNQSQYCYDIDGFDPALGWTRLQELLERRKSVAIDIGARVDEYRRRVEAQYDLIFGEPADD
jgi:polysaccharide pyruvyl transferase WcaK-like protein